MKWKKLIAIVLWLEALSLIFLFALPALQHKVFADPEFPDIIVYHQYPPGCIVDFRGNIFIASAWIGVFWTIVVILVIGAYKLHKAIDEFDSRRLKKVLGERQLRIE